MRHLYQNVQYEVRPGVRPMREGKRFVEVSGFQVLFWVASRGHAHFQKWTTDEHPERFAQAIIDHL